jgi:hypothetical protein
LISRRTLKLIAIGYAVKTALFAAAWVVVPDLPQRVLATACRAWVWAGGSPSPSHAHPHAMAGAEVPR